MTYVPDVKVDVFISYPMEAEEWARQFDKLLTDILRHKVAKPEIYLARRNWRGVSNEMLEHAGSTALFLAIVTRASLEDTGTIRFQELEAKAFGESRPEDYRFIPILLDSISEQDISKLWPLKGSNTFPKLRPFFIEDEDGYKITLKSDYEPIQYQRRIAQLADDLADKLRKLKKERKPKRPFEGLTVFLAPMEPEVDEPDLAGKLGEIHELLRSDGVTILPEQAYSGDDAAIASALAADLEKAHMVVQLLSLQKWERAKLQFAAAQQSVRKQSGPGRRPAILQWRFPLRPELLAYLPENDRELLEGPSTLVIDFQKFKNELRTGLNKIRQEENEPPRPPPPTKPYIYIAADAGDLAAASKLQDAGRRKGAFPCVMPDGEERLQDFSEAIECSNAVVFLYGSTKASFINFWLGRYVRKLCDDEIRAARQKRGLEPEPERAVLYEAPPENPQGQIMPPFDPLPRLGSRQELTVEDFERLCDDLARARDARLARTGAAEQGSDGI